MPRDTRGAPKPECMHSHPRLFQGPVDAFSNNPKSRVLKDNCNHEQVLVVSVSWLPMPKFCEIDKYPIHWTYIIFRRYCTKCKGLMLQCYRTCKKHVAKNPSQTGHFNCVDADDFHKTDLYVSIKGRVAPHLQGNKRRLKKARTALFKGMRYQNSNMERDWK